MNCSKLFLISMLCIAQIIQTESPVAPPNKYPELEKQVDAWLQTHFAPKLYCEVSYTEDLFRRIKQYLLAHNHIQYMPHKELKIIIKNQIVLLHTKKHHTNKWIRKNKKGIKTTVESYHQTHPHAKPQNIFEYLNTCKNKTCIQTQQALRNQDLLPEPIKQTIKNFIIDAQK